ncbi:MAG: ornithine cyclodeaminase family protein [Actinobacteria bacterium]|nr:ornithine cyclodeaminase family protein [Actinomycetota bacterium]
MNVDRSIVCLGAEEVRELLPMADCIELMATTLTELAHGELTQRHRVTVAPTPGSPGILGLLPAHRPGGEEARFGLKAVCVFPENPSRGLDAHQGVVLLFDGETGVLRAIADGSSVTSRRTAAVTAVATRALANPAAAELAIIGSGAQAGEHLEALALVRPFRRARLWSRTPANAERLAGEADVGFPVEPVEDVRAAVEGADVVVTLTPATEPLLRREWLAPGAHVNAIGASSPRGRELDEETLTAARIVVDWRPAVVDDGGEVMAAIASGALGEDDLVAELGQVLADEVVGRQGADQLTVFKSVGVAVEDMATVEQLERRARARNLGGRVDLT